ncbi:MAG: MFS transporter [Acetilactobacillus jinshanensis]
MQAMDLMFLSFALTPIIKQLHTTGTVGGTIASFSNFGMLVGSLIFGYLADNFGRVKVFTYTIFIFAFATAAMAFANNIYLIYLLRFLAGMGAGAEFGAGVTLIAENFKGDKVATFTSYAESFGELGAILSALISAWTYGWHVLFLFGLIPVILAFLVRLNLKENPKFIANLKKRRAEHKKHVSFKALFKTPKVAYLTCAMIVMYLLDSASYYGLMDWMPSIMQKQLHINLTQSSLWMVSTIVGVMLGMLCFGKMMDKFGAKAAFTFFFGCSIFVVYTIIMAYNSLTLLLASTLVGFFAEACYSGYAVIVSKCYPMDIRVTANGFVESCGKAIGGLSPILIGFLIDHYSLLAVVIFLSLLPLISLITIYSVLHMHAVSKQNILLIEFYNICIISVNFKKLTIKKFYIKLRSIGSLCPWPC